MTTKPDSNSDSRACSTCNSTHVVMIQIVVRVFEKWHKHYLCGACWLREERAQ
jgi:hypothetical protein